MKHDCNYYIGHQLVKPDYSLIGIITDIDNDGPWATIDDSYQIDIRGAEFINDLMGCHKARTLKLDSSFIGLRIV